MAKTNLLLVSTKYLFSCSIYIDFPLALEPIFSHLLFVVFLVNSFYYISLQAFWKPNPKFSGEGTLRSDVPESAATFVRHILFAKTAIKKPRFHIHRRSNGYIIFKTPYRKPLSICI